MPSPSPSKLSPLINEWKAQQTEMRRRLVVQPLNPLPRFIAGVDAAYSEDKKTALAVVPVYDREAQRLVEIRPRHPPPSNTPTSRRF